MEEVLTLTTVVDPKDDFDREVSVDILTMVSSLDSNSIIFEGDKKKSEDYFGNMLNLTNSLLKANQHYRNYVSIEREILVSYKHECIKNPNKSINLSKRPVNLNSEIDALLSQVKASLDTLGVSLRYTLDISIHGWRKDGEKSGGKIIKALNKLSPERMERTQSLKEYIENNTDWISYVVDLRDKADHHGGIKSISDITFYYKTQEVHPQLIKHSEGQQELVSSFLLNTLKFTKSFCHNVIALSVLSRVGKGLEIVKDEKQLGPPYKWAIKTESIVN